MFPPSPEQQRPTPYEVLYSPSSDRHYFACRLARLLSLAAISSAKQDYEADLCRRQVEFLTCLVNPRSESVTYDLRMISSPDALAPARGVTTLAILCRTDQITKDQAQQAAFDFENLLAAYFEEYEFRLVKAEEVKWLLAPFPIRHQVALTRRCGRETLDTLRSGARVSPRVGFGVPSSKAPSPSAGAESLFHIYPFLSSAAAPLALFKLMLLEGAPVAISFRLRPTALTPEEERILEQQIAICERYAQVGLGQIPEELSALRPTLQQQARAYQQFQERMLCGLRDNAAIMTIAIASAASISQVLRDVVGAMITQPAGGVESLAKRESGNYLAGGYELVELEESSAAAETFTQLDFHLPTHPLAPAGSERLLYLFDSVEAQAAFRLPPPTPEGYAGLEIKHWRERPGPRQLAPQGLLIGLSVHRSATQPVRLARDDRRRHIYAVGQTGTGKTTLLKTMILDDLQAGEGFCVIDPHGDLYHELLGKIPANRLQDVVLLDPTDLEWPVGLNMLEYATASQRHFLIQEMVAIISRIIEDEFGHGAVREFAGPVFFQHLRMNMLLAMSNPEDPGTLLEFYNIFQEEDYWKRWLPLRIEDPQLKRWVENVLPKTDYLRQGNDGVSMGGYIGSKFEGFLFDPMLRNIFGQKRSTIRLRAIMDAGKVLLINLAKGELTETNSRFLGMVLLAMLQAAAMERVGIPPHQRRDFHVYVDEFQSIATQSFITLLSEARKFGLSLVLANQFVSQIKDPRIMESVFGNVGTLICFRVGQQDAEIMEREMFPVFTRSDLINLPNWKAYMSTLVNGQTVPPFTVQTVLDDVVFDENRAQEAQRLSREKYSRPRAAVEREIARSLQKAD